MWTARGRSRLRFLQRLAISCGKRLDKRVRQMVGRHLDEIAVEGREQGPVLRLVGDACLATTRGALEARLELGGVQAVEEFDERAARGLRGGGLMQLCFTDGLAQPLHRVEAA